MQKIINKMLIVSLFFSVITLSFAGPLEDKIDKIKYEKELDFKNVPLADVLSIISKTSGVTIVPDSQVGNLNIDIYFGRGQSLGEIIRTLKVTHKLTTRELNSVIVLGKDLKSEALQAGSISGKILSKKTGEGLEGIKVYLVGEKEKTTLSSVGGYYILKNIEPGTYIVKAEGPKFKANGAIIEVKSAGGITQDISLSFTEEALNALTSTKPDATNENTIGKVTNAEGKDTFTERVQLKHAFANEVKTVLESVIGKTIEVTAIEKQNMVVLKGEEGNIQTAKNLIVELDKPIKQVRITAQVLEMTGGLTDELGINWGYAGGKASITGVDPEGKLLAESGALFGAPGGILKLASTLSSAGDIISASVKMLQDINDAEVSSRPSVVTLNGEKASLNFSKDMLVGNEETTDDKGNVTKKPLYKEAGTILTVKATIRDGGNEKDTIILDINSEVSSFDTNTGGGASQKNKVQNTVSLQDGGTIFIGGLKRTDLINNVSKVPFLGDIPVFGKLFQSQTVTNLTKDIFIQIKAEIFTAENANDDINGDGFKKSSVDMPQGIFNRK